ncbi:hypothetical protein [Acinetobacter phage vB_AbaS_TCUP2199]|nr:hypothetical protein [Acinetobacter phage vB_AbaS_TCUP2199]
MNIFPTDEAVIVAAPEYTAVQSAFIDAINNDQIPLLHHYFTINEYFGLNDDGEFEHIDTYAAFKIFEAGYVLSKAENEPLEDEQLEDEVLAAVSGRDPNKPVNSGKLKDWVIMIGVLIIGLIIGYYVNFAHLNSKIHF